MDVQATRLDDLRREPRFWREAHDALLDSGPLRDGYTPQESAARARAEAGRSRRFDARMGLLERKEAFRQRCMSAAGDAKRAMEAAEELVRNKGLNTVGLSVAARNPKQNAARELYKKLNYSEAGYGEYTVTYSYMDLDGNTHHDEDQYVYLVKSIESG